MADSRKISQFCIDAILEAGHQQAECSLSFTRKTEFTVEDGSISLMRTTDDTGLSLTGIKDQRKGSSSINKTDERSMLDSVAELTGLVDANEPDPANEIAENQPQNSFTRGPEKPDVDLMYTRIKSFLKHSKEKYPTLILEQVILDHTARRRSYVNSNGVDFQSVRGGYNFMAMFSSKVGTSISSFNYVAVSTADLSEELCTLGGLDRLMSQSTEQTVTGNLQGSFEGDVIITPECLGDFISMIASYFYDYPLITGTSIYKDSLDEIIADERLFIHSRPVSDELAGGYFFTGDGFKSANSTIIENGVLKTFLLGLYGSRKTGLDKAVNSGGFYVIDPGETSFDEMVKSVDKGILLCRFSGGSPSSSGDFSGVAKNSYLIENGEIKNPVSETMIAGNMKDMLKRIKHISSETVNSGNSIMPWITFSGITISGK
ncbi:MAG: TldD/PmbA family protein [Candidatus Sabulitectum sp.]|nr:TldD/PmbA family protein [Candidatus Sabulitectum sp.]